MKELLYLNMQDITIEKVLEMAAEGYEFHTMENGYALAAKGGIL